MMGSPTRAQQKPKSRRNRKPRPALAPRMQNAMDQRFFRSFNGQSVPLGGECLRHAVPEVNNLGRKELDVNVAERHGLDHSTAHAKARQLVNGQGSNQGKALSCSNLVNCVKHAIQKITAKVKNTRFETRPDLRKETHSFQAVLIERKP